MDDIVILGGGEAGYTIAHTLQHTLRGKAKVTVVDERAHMVYQPFLAEVVSGSIEPRHIEVPYHRHLRNCEIVCARVKSICAAKHEVLLENMDGMEWTLGYGQLVVTLGAVTKTFPTPGIADNAIGLKSVEEAVHIRNKVIMNFNRASSMYKDNPNRKRLLTFVVVGGGFSGMECFAEMRSLATKLLRDYPSIDEGELEFHLIEATDHIMPEIPLARSERVIEDLEKRNAHVHLSTLVNSAEDGVVRTSDGAEYPTELIVWTAGSLANPVLKDSDLPLDGRGRLRCRLDLRVEGDDGIVDGVWGAGDCCNVPDVSGDGLPDGTCAPTAQHAARQAKLLASNLYAVYNNGSLNEYHHANAGMVAGLGAGLGVFTDGSKKHGVNGPLAWVAHRGYHGLVMPTVERKVSIFFDWLHGGLFGTDTATTSEFARPRELFTRYALRPEAESSPAKQESV
ncbi:MAG: NAD(P)/FAD-dependent oxidoreductase [Coriobacteriales bacterium]|jgi:NADH dehydrogenase